ncbi:hypothetical protein FNYG_00494 [Fusarium nygamai]|uniref:Uncharacterized protein n=1 Tax=Gibberella nygamai TaxID=42673 RepID=A0A2K0WVH5_GIBNY|nr:hypothetical protein FNYG_00494 [Fusarium nygamai]
MATQTEPDPPGKGGETSGGGGDAKVQLRAF